MKELKKRRVKKLCIKSDEFTLMEANYPSEVTLYEPITSKKLLYKIPNNRPVRVYCDGVYDVFHYGHARSLKQAKFLFPNVHLIVGVSSDKLTEEYKGPTVYNENERAEGLLHCKYVDEVVKDCPWIITDDFISKHSIDFIAHDEAPYKHGDCEDIYKVFKDRKIFVPIMRSRGISTSKIITNIIKDYDKYVIRNLDRGCTPKELNISFLQFNRLKLTSKFKRQYDSLMDDINNIKSELRYANMYWDMVFQRLIDKIKNERIIERIIEFIK